MSDAIQISGLRKRYGGHTVLNGLDLRVRRGEIFALLGVNGAGKTTTLECVEGLRTYDGSSVTVNGKMGVQLQSASLPGLPGTALSEDCRGGVTHGRFFV